MAGTRYADEVVAVPPVRKLSVPTDAVDRILLENPRSLFGL
jgi:hypothetical protein